MIQFLNIFCFYFIAILLITFYCLNIFIGIKLHKKFDPYFPDFVNSKISFESGWWILSPWIRGLRYAGCILFKNATTKRAYCRYFFQGFNFRAKASWIDLILIHTMIWSAFIGTMLGGMMYIFNGGKLFIFN